MPVRFPVLTLLLVVAGHSPARGQEAKLPEKSRSFTFVYAATVTGLPPGTRARVWLPVPATNDEQQVREREDDAKRRREPVAPIERALDVDRDRMGRRVMETRGGEKLYDSQWGVRHTGVGVYAQTIATMFEKTKQRLGLGNREEPDPVSRFRRPEKPTAQLSLF